MLSIDDNTTKQNYSLVTATACISQHVHLSINIIIHSSMHMLDGHP